MFDPSTPSRCTCGRPDCTARLVDGQRVRAITDQDSAVAFLHPEDVVECLNAVLRQVLDSEGPYAAAVMPLMLAVGQFVADWISDPYHHVPAGYVFPTLPLDNELITWLDEFDQGDTHALEQALNRILDEG